MPALAIREVAPGLRRPYLPLLRLADDSEAEIASYINTGRLFVAGDPNAERAAIAHALLAQSSAPKTAELRSIAIAESHRRRGYGRSLVDHVCAEARAMGCDLLEVATATSGVDAITFYLRLGFRPHRIERDHFSPERGYPAGTLENGILLRDQIGLDRTL